MNDSMKNWPIDAQGNLLPADEIVTTEEYVENEKASHKKFFHYRNLFFLSVLLFAFVVVKYAIPSIFSMTVLVPLFIVFTLLCLITFSLSLSSYHDWKQNAQLLYIHNMPQSETDELFRGFCEANPKGFMMLWKSNPNWIKEFREQSNENAEWCDAHPELFDEEYVNKQSDAMDN